MALTSEKYQQKRQTLVERTSLALNISAEEAGLLLSIGRQQSIRINTLKNDTTSILERLAQLDASLRPVEWMKGGFFIESGLPAIRDSELVESGEVYIQNAASWLPVLALDPAPGENILDMCAAPGGKTSHIAQKAQNQAFITANDNSRPRLHKLQNNLQRLGVENASFTLHDATRLSRTLESASFDKILLDAPCSGEGMMQIDGKKDFESWSVAHIKRLQQLQKKLVVQAWQLLKPGGRLVYSTCTMAPEENEAVLDYLLRHNEDVKVEDITWLSKQLDNTSPSVAEWNGKEYDARVKQAVRLHPSPEVEAFFVVSLKKEEV